jgi:hypothetical protein
MQWEMNEQMIWYIPWYFIMYIPLDIPWYILLIYIMIYNKQFMVYTMHRMVYTRPFIPWNIPYSTVRLEASFQEAKKSL